MILMAIAWLMLWFARDGIRDNSGGPLDALDILYFAVVTVTTLGYGDIVPISPEARAIITFGITPLRILTWMVLLTTAYELVLRRSIERIEMQQLKNSLNGHVVVCGFGVKGRSAVKELLERKRVDLIDACGQTELGRRQQALAVELRQRLFEAAAHRQQQIDVVVVLRILLLLLFFQTRMTSRTKHDKQTTQLTKRVAYFLRYSSS